jgi:hypothetical protein
MLAVALSGETEARVLLAAFDVSRPSLAKRFGVHPEPGAVDHLEQSATMRVIGGGPSGAARVAPRREPAARRHEPFRPPRVGLRLLRELPAGVRLDSARPAGFLDNPDAAILVRFADTGILFRPYRSTAVNAVSRAAS